MAGVARQRGAHPLDSSPRRRATGALLPTGRALDCWSRRPRLSRDADRRGQCLVSSTPRTRPDRTESPERSSHAGVMARLDALPGSRRWDGGARAAGGAARHPRWAWWRRRQPIAPDGRDRARSTTSPCACLDGTRAARALTGGMALGVASARGSCRRAGRPPARRCGSQPFRPAVGVREGLAPRRAWFADCRRGVRTARGDARSSAVPTRLL